MYLMKNAYAQVLTSRIAHLILDGGLPPSSICAVTFTNKAANEMQERLTKLIGKELASAVKLGTFHSICARFLRNYGTAVGLEENFTVCNADARYALSSFWVLLNVQNSISTARR